jgi:FtsP/CotA-like multicopper oxidase with cupredoxin domain
VSRGQRLGLVVLAVAVAVAAFLVLGSDDDDEDGGGDRAASTVTETQTTTTGGRGAGEVPGIGSEAPGAGRGEPRIGATHLKFRGGKPVGGVKRIAVQRGDRVRIDVTVDEPHEVHLHGYDISKDVKPGRPARFRFKADIEGIFEVEIEDLHLKIAELRVEP